MDIINLYYIVGILFFSLAALLLLIFIIITLTTYFKIKKKLEEFKDIKFTLSLISKAFKYPKRALLPVLALLTTILIKLKQPAKET